MAQPSHVNAFEYEYRTSFNEPFSVVAVVVFFFRLIQFGLEHSWMNDKNLANIAHTFKFDVPENGYKQHPNNTN